MSNLFDAAGNDHLAMEAAEQFIKLAANGAISDGLVEDLRYRKFSEPLAKLAASAQMTPWVFLDFVARQVATDAFNDVMLGSISPQIFGLLAMLNRPRNETANREATLAELSRDLKLALVPA